MAEEKAESGGVTAPADFGEAFLDLLKYEGGWSDDPDDTGGKTNFGLSQKWLNEVGLKDDPSAITKARAFDIYKEYWWEQYGLDRFPHVIASKLFDAMVNTGPAQGVKFLQRSLRANGCNWVGDDGIIGAVTVRAANQADPTGVLIGMRSEQAGYYRLLIAKKAKRRKWRKGWLRRAYGE